MAARSFLGAGDVYFDRLVDGVKQGRVGPIYADSLSITPSVETVQSTSKGRYDYGQVLESVNIAQPSEFSMALKEVTGDILTMAFLGTSSTFTAVTGRKVPSPTCSVTSARRTPLFSNRWKISGVKCSPAVGAATAPCSRA